MKLKFSTFVLLWTDEATTILCHFKVFSKTLYRVLRGLHTFIVLQHFMVFTETIYCSQTSSRLHRQALHRHVILWAKCIFHGQALCLLYLSHPPETGNGRKQSFDNWSDEKEKLFSGIWPSSVRNVSKQRLLTPTNATLLGWTKSFLFRCSFEFSCFFSRQRWKLSPSTTHA